VKDTEEKTKHDVIYLYVHGAAQPNPGPAGAGVVGLDEDKETLFEIKEFLGHKTNNQAEYETLILGLRHLEDHHFDAQELMIRSENELMVKQLRSEYKVTDVKLMELKKQVDDLLTFQEHRIQKIKKKMNARAIKLSREAIAEAPKS
jgi:ribonuclease HI